MSKVRILSNLLDSSNDVAVSYLDNVTPYSLPTASTTVLGGVKVGANLSISSGVLAGAAPYSKPSAEPISYITGLQTALDAKTTPAYVDTQVAALVAAAPATLDTLNELAAALGDDANHVTTMTNLVATKLSLTGGTMTGNIAHAGAFTLDVGSEIYLDSDSGYVYLQDAGTSIGLFKLTSSDFYIKSVVSDKDIIFQGNDGGSGIEAMRIDMSAGGNVGIGTTSPSEKLQVAGNIQFGGGGGGLIEEDGTTVRYKNLHSGGTVNLMTHDGSEDIQLDPSGWMRFETGGKNRLKIENNRYQFFNDSGGDGSLYTQGTSTTFDWQFNTYSTNNALKIINNGNVGIGLGSGTPSNRLHVATGDSTNDNYRTGADTPLIVEGTTASYLQFVANANAPMGILMGDASDSGVGAVHYDADGGGMMIASGGYTRMTISTTGNVNIGGLPTTDSKLNVKGSIEVAPGTAGNTTGINTLLSSYGYNIGGTKYGQTAIGSHYDGPSNHGALVFSTTGGTIPPVERMRIDSAGNVGIGTSSPNAPLEVLKSGGGKIRVSETSNRYVEITGYAEATANGSTMVLSTVQAGTSTLTERLRLDYNGNMGLGVVPESDWYSNATALQISPTAALYNTSNWEDFSVANNAYYNSSAVESYIQNDAACKIRLTDAGMMDFRVATSGTAGNAIPWTTALTIENNGRMIGKVIMSLTSGTGRWDPSGQWGNLGGQFAGTYNLANFPNACLYLCEAAIQYLGGYTASMLVFKTYSGQYQVIQINNTSGSMRMNGSYVQYRQGSGADQTNTSGYQRITSVMGTL